MERRVSNRRSRAGAGNGAHHPDPAPERHLVTLAWIARRWSCSRNTVRRILRSEGAVPFYLGGGSRNATLRFDFTDVLAAEERSKLTD